MACNSTADCKSLATIDLLGAGVGKIIRFICGKSIGGFPLFKFCLLQDFSFSVPFLSSCVQRKTAK